MNIDWEAAFAPYDEDTYRCVLERITPQDVVLDIGAGDLRLARRAAAAARRVYAIECNPAVLAHADRSSWPANLIVICADALSVPFPPDVTVAVLLMRHCTRAHFARYVERLTALGECRRLLTNARWKMDVEEMYLRSGRRYAADRVGWYTCRCGAVGFTPGDPRGITPQILAQVVDVITCPQCDL
jgi:SAM-dependent methyltransferase